MAELDIKSAYRIVPVHPKDWFLLGMQWKERIYVDAAPPLGLKSAAPIFTALADALEWMVQQHARSSGISWRSCYGRGGA